MVPLLMPSRRLLVRAAWLSAVLLVVGATGPIGASAQNEPRGEPLDRASSQALGARDAAARQALRDVAGADGRGVDGPLDAIGYDLARLYRSEKAEGKAATAARPPGMPVEDGLVTIDAVARADDPAGLRADLEALGLRGGATAGRLVSGRLPVEALGGAARLESLHSAYPAYAATAQGRVVSQGVESIQADALRSALETDGAGVTVGVISDSYDTAPDDAVATTAADDIASGDLPNRNRIAVLDDGTAGSDEGRALMQIVHDVAPGADLAFHTGFGGRAAFANGIRDLADEAGASVIVDDVINFGEAMYQDGVVAQAVADVTARRDVAYFTSAGNQGTQAYGSPFRASGADPRLGATGASVHDFDPGPGDDPLQRITIGAGVSVQLSFHWSQPAASAGGAGAQSDLEIYIADKTGTIRAQARRNNVGGDPFEVLSFENDDIDADGDGRIDTTFQVGIERVRGPAPERMRYVLFAPIGGADLNEHVAAPTAALTERASVFGHANAREASAVGAALYTVTPPFFDGAPLVNSYSSVGGIPILYDETGRPISPQQRDKPDLTAPDGVNTTFFGSDFEADDDSFPNFLGTSAAAPHVAGLAAVLRSSAPALTSNQVRRALAESAVDIEGVFDVVAGSAFPIPSGAGADPYSGTGLVRGSRVEVPAVEVDDVAVEATGDRRATVRWTEGPAARARDYRVQQSYFGRPYEPVGPTRSGGEGRYQVAIDSLQVGTHRFRVAWTRTDGTTQTSRPVQATVELGRSVRLSTPFPNPTDGGVRVEIASDTEQNVLFVLYDRLGRRLGVVASARVSANKPRTVRIPGGRLHRYASGTYFLRALGESFVDTVPVVLVR
jgi:hypothetical protein